MVGGPICLETYHKITYLEYFLLKTVKKRLVALFRVVISRGVLDRRCRETPATE